MNTWLIVAGALLLLACYIHTFAGNRLYGRLAPRKTGVAEPEAQEAWLLGRGGWQIVGADLLLTGLALLGQGLGVIPYCFELTLFIAVLYGVYALVFPGAFAVEKVPAATYRENPQWVLFALVCALTAAGMAAERI